MARFLLALLLICGLSISLLIFGLLHDPSGTPPGDDPHTGARAASKNTSSSKAEPGRTARQMRTRSRYSSPVKKPAVTALQPQEAKPPVAVDPAKAVVGSEALPMYSEMSPHSSVVRVLKKGDVVKTDLEVLGNEGVWSSLTENGQKGSGYVRGENLHHNGGAGTGKPEGR